MSRTLTYGCCGAPVDASHKLTCPDNGGHLAEIAAGGVRALLESAGLDWKNDSGLKDTPDRVVRAFREFTAGYREDPAKILARTFETENDEMVLVTDIEFASLCEHHLLPFHGLATVGYIPGLIPEEAHFATLAGTDLIAPQPCVPRRKIVGLSKIPRLVHCFARRLQVQESLTREIAQALAEHLDPIGVGVVIEATHTCMSARGVRASGAKMTTSCLLGEFRARPEVRAEFLALAGRRGA
jgi:GTP cyclohydrolase I